MMAEMMRLQPSKVQFIHSYPQARDHGTGIEMCSLFIHVCRRGTMAAGIEMLRIK